MSHTRAPLVIASLLLLLAPACGSSEEYSSGPPDGRKLYVGQGCTTCHKADGGGGPLGPPLKRAAEYWSREELASYLANPKKYVDGDARLQSLARTFRMQMPPVSIDLDQRLLLADYVRGFATPPEGK